MISEIILPLQSQLWLPPLHTVLHRQTHPGSSDQDVGCSIILGLWLLLWHLLLYAKRITKIHDVTLDFTYSEWSSEFPLLKLPMHLGHTPRNPESGTGWATGSETDVSFSGLHNSTKSMQCSLCKRSWVEDVITEITQIWHSTVALCRWKPLYSFFPDRWPPGLGSD